MILILQGETDPLGIVKHLRFNGGCLYTRRSNRNHKDFNGCKDFMITSGVLFIDSSVSIVQNACVYSKDRTPAEWMYVGEQPERINRANKWLPQKDHCSYERSLQLCEHPNYKPGLKFMALASLDESGKRLWKFVLITQAVNVCFSEWQIRH